MADRKLELRELLEQLVDHLPASPPGEPATICDPPVHDEDDPAMTSALPKPRFDRTFNYGHVLTALGMIIGWIAGGLWISTQLGRFQEQLVVMRRDVDAAVIATNERVRIYVPRIDSLERDNQVQSERIQNLAVAVQDQRKVSGEIVSILGNIREDMATIRARLSIGQRRTELQERQAPQQHEVR